MTAENRWSCKSSRSCRSNLEALGLSPDSSDEGNLGSGARDLLEQLKPHMLDGFPDLQHWKGRQPFTSAPWADSEGSESAPARQSLGPDICVQDIDEEVEFLDLLRS
jgi:hypothetical protein